MDLHLMQLVKRLFAWADANDDTRNMELHMQVAFGLLAEQGAATTPKHALTAAELDVRDRPVIRQIQLTQSYRWERAKLASRIAEGLHCRFLWIGSLTQEAPTVGCFIGCRPHADRARLLFEVMDPDLRLLTRFIGPPQGAGWGASGPPPASARQYFASRSAAMLDVINWTYERLYETEVLAASRKGLADDFAEDRRLADEFVDEMWGDTMSVYDLGAGQPDYPMADGLPAERFQEFLDELAELEAAEEEDADEEVSEFEDPDYDPDVDPDADPDDDFDYSFDFLDEDEEGDEDEDEEGDAEEGGADDDAEDGDTDESEDEYFAPSSTGCLPLFDLPGAGYPSESPAGSTIADATWVYFIEGQIGEDVDPCLIRFGIGGWQLYFPAMGQWFRDDAAEKMATESGLFVQTTREDAEDWVFILEDPVEDGETGETLTVESEIDKCLALGFDEDTARQVVRMRWANLPDALLSE
ncbi:hypothetical protein [Corynebacterium xerosis]|uniref:hypothetical protein n=1 Tax=Corynebacterium xerosis TaxID=1725 RepID=UPI0011BDDF97|nr:hypothetical protein [Corynebacterium xerosis]